MARSLSTACGLSRTEARWCARRGVGVDATTTCAWRQRGGRGVESPRRGNYCIVLLHTLRLHYVYAEGEGGGGGERGRRAGSGDYWRLLLVLEAEDQKVPKTASAPGKTQL